MTDVPQFAVVGNVNQGKSSVVAALSENVGVPVDSYPGTTRDCARYVFRVDGDPVLQIIDTPGFQSARRALAWIKDRAESPADRRAAVEDFVAIHRDDPNFVDEVRLLEPILNGAGVLYVVDSGSRFQPANEAEMEILRWTGQPGMALLNRIGEHEWSEEWRPILGQFFNSVTEFDAHRAGLDERLELLRSFAVIRSDWRSGVERAVDVIREGHERKFGQAAAAIAAGLVDAMRHVERRRLSEGDDADAMSREVESAFHDQQRKIEQRTRDEVEAVFGHSGVAREDSDIELLSVDLFSDTSWQLLGLERGQLARYGAGWGAVIGGTVDAMVGGLSFFAGAGIGAGIGALSGWFGGKEVAKVWTDTNRISRWLAPSGTGRFVAMGPVTGLRFAWVLLDRALVHGRAVGDRSHARRDVLNVAGEDQKVGVVAALPKERRNELDSALREVTKAAIKGRDRDEGQRLLADAVHAALKA